MKIADIRDAMTFQGLVHRLMVAEHGANFHVPDDSGGDRGNDGYDAARGILYAIYCPEKPATADYRKKALADLAKAASLATERGYSITHWTFVTPTPLRERLQADIRAAAKNCGLIADFMADTHLEDLLRKHTHIRDEVPALEYPLIARQLESIRAPLVPFRVFFTLESEVSDDDLARVFSRHPGYRRYSADQPLPGPPDGPPPGCTSCRIHRSDGYLDFTDGRIAAAGICHLMGSAHPTLHRPAAHTVCRLSRSSLKATISPNEPLCMQPEVAVEVTRPIASGLRADHSGIVFRSPMADATKSLRLCAIDNAVFADFLTDGMESSPADASAWSLYDLGGSLLRFTFTFFYMDGIASLPEASWPRLHGLHLIISDQYVVSFAEASLEEQRRGRSAEVKIAFGAVAPTIHLECSLPQDHFMDQLRRMNPMS